MKKRSVLLLTIMMSIFVSITIVRVQCLSQFHKLRQDFEETSNFRAQSMNENQLHMIQEEKDPGLCLGLYWLSGNSSKALKSPTNALSIWENHPLWSRYCKQCRACWNHIECFPVGVLDDDSNKNRWSYIDTWQAKRTYGGKRTHEGCDIIPDNQTPGIYPILSVCDGVITKKGWLEQGGYRVGVESKEHIYYYYAHLDSYSDLDIGDQVKAGQILGYMGNTGYGKKEGTSGKFPVHLHFGVYLLKNKKEISVNPYWMLRYMEEKSKIHIQ